MSQKRSGKSSDAAARKAIEHALELSEFHSRISDAGSEVAEAFAAPSTGACFITVKGHTHCHRGVTRASCEFAANKAGGVANWVPGGLCE